MHQDRDGASKSSSSIVGGPPTATAELSSSRARTSSTPRRKDDDHGACRSHGELLDQTPPRTAQGAKNKDDTGHHDPLPLVPHYKDQVRPASFEATCAGGEHHSAADSIHLAPSVYAVEVVEDPPTLLAAVMPPFPAGGINAKNTAKIVVPQPNALRDRRFQALLMVFLVIVGGLVVGLTLALKDDVHDEPSSEQPRADLSEPSVCSFDILEETNLFGSDIDSFIPIGTEFEEAVDECKNICASVPSCKSFTLVDSGKSLSNNPEPWCYVKDGIPGESSSAGMTSGILTSDCPEIDVASEFVLFNATNFPFMGLYSSCFGDPSITSLEAMTYVCLGICKAMSECKAFTAVDPALGSLFDSYSCCLKAGVPSFEQGQSQYTNSGIKILNN